MQLYWINTFKPGREEVLQTQTPIRNGTDTTINSYDTHHLKKSNKLQQVEQGHIISYTVLAGYNFLCGAPMQPDI